MLSRVLWLGAVVIAVMAPGAPAVAGVFQSADYYRLLRDFSGDMRKPEQTSEEKQAKVEALSKIAFRARRMWNQSNGFEQMGGTPPGASGSSAGVEPIHYRPRLLDLYANWKAATLTEDEALKSTLYRNVVLALPPAFEKWPAPYREPAVYALVVDANLHLGTDLSDALTEWARLAASRPPSLDVLRAHLRQPERPALNAVEPGFPARQINDAYLQVCKDVGLRLTQSIKVSADSQLRLEREDPLTVTGHYEGLVPIRLRAENEQGSALSDDIELVPNADFVLPLTRIAEGQSGQARLCWSFPPGAVPGFLLKGIGRDKFQVEGWTAGYTYHAFRRKVHFSVLQASLKRMWVTGPGGLNRDTISISYLNDAQAGPFHWRVLDEKKHEVIPGTLEEKPDGSLTIDPGKLGRGAYTLCVREDPTNPDAAVSGEFVNVAEFKVTGPGVALVMGIDAYDSGASLKHACDDAQAIRDQLRLSGYSDDDVIYVKGITSDDGHGQIITNAGQEAGLVTTNKLADALVRFLTLINTRHPSRAVLFYSGHGQTVIQKDGSTTQELVPGDRSVNIIKDPKTNAVTRLEVQCIYLDEFLEAIQALDSSAGKPTYVALIDACRSVQSGSTDSVDLKQLPAGPYRAPDNLLVPIYSCKLGEKSNESGSGANAVAIEGDVVNHGFFTYALLQGMKSAPDGKLGLIMAGGAVDVMRQLMADASNKNGKVKSLGDSARALPYSEQQTITVGDRALESADSVKALPDEVRNVTLF